MSRHSIVVSALMFLALSACTKDNTDHPDYARIASFTADWSLRSEGIDVPAVYNVSVGTYSTTLPSGTANPIDNIFSPGRYTIHAYNQVNGISVTGAVATADYSVAGGIGWLFTGVNDVSLDRDND